MKKQLYFQRDHKNFAFYRMFIFSKNFKDPRTGHYKLIDALIKFSSQTRAETCKFFCNALHRFLNSASLSIRYTV